MKMLLFVAVLLVAGAPAQAQPQSEDTEIASAKSKLAMKLKDPDSAHYTGVVKSDKGGLVCGWVNSKNSFGGYVGFQPFVVFGNQVMIRDIEANDFSNQDLFASIWSACSPMKGESFGQALVGLPKFNITKQCAKKRKRSDRPALYAHCEQSDADALAWLEEHRTSAWLAHKCTLEARRFGSYGIAKMCVTSGEINLVIDRGPPVSGQASP